MATAKTGGEAGFTLAEIVIVVGLIGLLAAIGIPAFCRSRERSRVHRAISELRMLAGAVQKLEFDTGMLPGPIAAESSSGAEVMNLNSPDAGLVTNSFVFGRWNGPYMRPIQTDPWGRPYFFDPDYRVHGVLYQVVGSYGPNGNGHNVYDSDNIYVLVGRTGKAVGP